MSFVNDLKKIFFGAKSVSKSAAEKAADKAAEQGTKMAQGADELFDSAKEKATDVGGELMDSAGDLFENAKEKATDIGGTVFEKASDLFEKAKDTASDASRKLSDSESVEKAKNFTEDVGSKVMDTGNDLLDKAAQTSELVGGKVLEKGSEFFDDAKKIAGEKSAILKEQADELFEKAQAEAEKDKIEDSMSDLDKMERDLAERVKNRDAKGAFGDDTSLLDGKDDFFSRAEKYAAGDYHGTGKTNAPPPTPTPEEDSVLDLLPLPEDKKEATPFTGEIKGFEDQDGDGDPVIDDAIIIENDDVKLLDDEKDGDEDGETKDS